MKVGRTLLCLSVIFVYIVIILSMLIVNCAPNPPSKDQIAQIEKISQLKPYDMVMDKDGRIFMVVREAFPPDKEKADWEITLREEHDGFDQFMTFQLKMLTEPGRVERIFLHDDPQWSVASMCYLRGIDCRGKLKQK